MADESIASKDGSSTVFAELIGGAPAPQESADAAGEDAPEGAEPAKPKAPRMSRADIDRARQIEKRRVAADKTEKQLKAEQAKFSAERAAFKAEVDAIRTGDMATKCKVLGRLGNIDPVDLFRELSDMASGKQPQSASREEAIYSKLQALESQLAEAKQGKQEQDASAQRQAKVQSARAMVTNQLAAAIQDPDEPELGELAKTIGQREAVDFMMGVGRKLDQLLREHGQRLTPGAATDRIARAVRKYLRSPNGKEFLASHHPQTSRPTTPSRPTTHASSTGGRDDRAILNELFPGMTFAHQVDKKTERRNRSNDRSVVNELFPGMFSEGSR
jgi:hypothetical protein